MQAKLGLGFLTVALLYVVIGLTVPFLDLSPPGRIALTASSYVVIGLGASWYLSALTTRRLRALARTAREISKGDLSREVDVSGNDETAEVARSLSVMAANLIQIVREVQATSDQIGTFAHSLALTSTGIHASTDEIASTARAIAREAEDQANQVLRIADATHALSRTVDRVAGRARDVHDSASAAAEQAARSAADARRTVEAIGQLARRSTSAISAVEGFRSRATEIGDIVGSIASVSRQTHLLAINAAIEAARAGEEGRGFGIVAEEIGRLADSVRRCADRITSISDEITQDSLEVAAEIRKNGEATDELRDTVESSAASFEGLLTAIRGTASEMGRISELTDEQKLAAEEAARSLEEISQIAARNASGTEEACSATGEQSESVRRMAESVHDLADTSDHLNELVTVFRVP